jgi:LysR family glycine cleavage system transcriptional activator
MTHSLPPMHALRTFETLGRLRHFARTAAALHLTASAVSHQIKALEDFYGTPLFRRERRVVGRFLQELAETGAALRQRDEWRLALTVPPSFASRWLMPRLGAFLAGQPRVDFQLHATLELVDLEAAGMDLAIRYGKGRWRGMRSQKLFDETVHPVASPAYLARTRIRTPADLVRAVRLRDDFCSWEAWFAQTRSGPAASPDGPDFGDSVSLLQAAEAGQGVALARSLLVADAVAAGALVRIGRTAMAAGGSYYLVNPTRRPDTAAVRAFRAWIAAQR